VPRAEVEDGGEAHVAVEMAVQVDEGQAGRHEKVDTLERIK
jgi:hypothetical protein